MDKQLADIYLDERRTERLINTCQRALDSSHSTFDAGKILARKLGAHKNGNVAEIGFWIPELQERRIPDDDIFFEILDADEPLSLETSRQEIRFRRTLIPVERYEAFAFAAIRGMTVGTREKIGSFYSVVWRDREGVWHRILDPLAASLPFGAFAPAEYYDVEAMQSKRQDRDYFHRVAAAAPFQDHVKFGPPSSILQLHVPTATAGGTLASLTRYFHHLGERLVRGLPLEPLDRIYLGYNAIQLLPVEPTTVYETGPEFWVAEPTANPDDREVRVKLRRPDTTNWGYDVVTAGMAAVNPALLETGRPDELADLAAVLHNFPRKPKKLILDVVYGHSDNQGLDVLNHHYFAGPNQYGQNMNYKHGIVRAVLLEMQRRKVNFGADGVRVDGAQDFQWYDASANVMRHDDEYLQSMTDIVQDVGGVRYRPWFIFEDGRPWPNEDWELASTYHAVIDNLKDDDIFQWGPLTFAHNTPFVYSFWLTKWWRIREIIYGGSRWISGCANHDTLRRGTQLSPKLNINTRLGETRMDILDKAYDNPAVNLMTYAAFPGVPMDFLNASARASWGFIRNQDDRYGVKIVAEEAISLKWQVDSYAYSLPASFVRLKELGFEERDELARFLEFLPALVEVTDYDLDVITKLLNEVDPPLAGPHPYTPEILKKIARSWMDDMHDYCNVSHYESLLSDEQTAFNFELRKFRDARPWLRENYGPTDYFDYWRPVNGTVLFTSLRRGPDGEQVFVVGHMEGSAIEDVDPLELPIYGLKGDGWELALKSPGIDANYTGGHLSLTDSTGLLFTRKPEAVPAGT